MQHVNFKDFIDQLSAFFTIATMGFTYSIANGICAGFIFFSWMRILRYLVVEILVKRLNRPEWAPEHGVETDLPHPLMILMAIFMSIRFAYLKA